MTIEKEFFEAFKYEPEYRILMGRRKIDNIPVYEYFKTLADAEQFLLDEFEEGLGAKNIEEVYPPITPEIVDKLEDIIFKMSPYYNTKSLNYNKWSKQRYYVVTLYCHRITKRRKVNSNTFEAAGFTRKDALLRLCIQLKDKIQEEVKALFINKQNGVTNE